MVAHTKTNEECCIVQSIVKWFKLMICSDQLGMPCMDYNGYLFKNVNGDNIITDQLDSEVMKDIINHLGWKADKMSSYSVSAILMRVTICL